MQLKSSSDTLKNGIKDLEDWIARKQYPGAIYHLMNRGDRRERIFKDDHDRHRFLGTLAEACEKTDWSRFGIGILMSNHFHLVVETPQEFVPTRRSHIRGHLLRKESDRQSY